MTRLGAPTRRPAQAKPARYARWMPDPELGRNEAERWFERYLQAHGYEYEYEPTFEPEIPTRPDFKVWRGGAEMVCEVKGFEEMPPVERRVSGTSQPTMLSSKEVLGPMRGAVREAARNLKPLAGSPWPLVVVLANPMRFKVFLSLDNLVEAMFGDLGVAGAFNAEKGQVENMQFEYGRDGRLRNDHPYISAVAILNELELAAEYKGKWYEDWKESREMPANPSYEEVAAEVIAAEEAWQGSDASRDVPEGNAYWVDVLTTGSPEAVPLPENVFDGPRDSRREVERVPG
jgi:hypothetical protein